MAVCERVETLADAMRTARRGEPARVVDGVIIALGCWHHGYRKIDIDALDAIKAEYNSAVEEMRRKYHADRAWIALDLAEHPQMRERAQAQLSRQKARNLRALNEQQKLKLAQWARSVVTIAAQ